MSRQKQKTKTKGSTELFAPSGFVRQNESHGDLSLRFCPSCRRDWHVSPGSGASDAPWWAIVVEGAAPVGPPDALWRT